MVLFYSNQVINESATLKGDEFKHCVKSYRKREGDRIFVTDGKGSCFNAEIIKIEKSQVLLRVYTKQLSTPNLRKLHIAISLLKNSKRLEWFFEKATEIGIAEITPLICQRTEKKSFNTERAKNILISAMKQSQRVYLPRLNRVVDFKDLIQSPAIGYKKLIASHHPDNPGFEIFPLQNTDILIVIGPEGDFTNDELKMAEDLNFEIVNLGNSRLRTETAGVVASSVFNMNCKEFSKK